MIYVTVLIYVCIIRNPTRMEYQTRVEYEESTVAYMLYLCSIKILFV